MIPISIAGSAWAAGFFDGEGHIRFNRLKNKYNRNYYNNLILEIAQNDRYVLERFKATLFNRGSINGPYLNRNSNSKPFYKYTVCNFQEIQFIMGYLWKYLSPIKRDQFKLALSNFNTYKRLK